MPQVGVGFQHSNCFGNLSSTRVRFLRFGTMVSGVCWRTRRPAGDVDDVSGLPFARLGARGFSVGGRIPLYPAVVADLSSLFRRSAGIASLGFPSFW